MNVEDKIKNVKKVCDFVTDRVQELILEEADENV